MMLVDGNGFLQIGSAIFPMQPLVAYSIPPKTIHRLSSSQGYDCVVVEVSSPELDDVVRLNDDYGRANAA